ncbi:duf890 domain protein [Moniliophthora roreri]|nr:duf890 domain protein [Moniliophthora roreri]
MPSRTPSIMHHCRLLPYGFLFIAVSSFDETNPFQDASFFPTTTYSSHSQTTQQFFSEDQCFGTTTHERRLVIYTDRKGTWGWFRYVSVSSHPRQSTHCFLTRTGISVST